MKVLKKVLTMFLLLSMTAGPTSASFISIEKIPPKENRHSLIEEPNARLESIKKRVAEIKSIDKSKLTKAERADLRKELKHMLKEAKKMSTKSFLVIFGGIIIVILILILAF